MRPLTMAVTSTNKRKVEKYRSRATRIRRKSRQSVADAVASVKIGMFRDKISMVGVAVAFHKNGERSPATPSRSLIDRLRPSKSSRLSGREFRILD